MIKLLLLIFFVGSFLSLVIYSVKFRTIAFWVSLMLFFDPGGFFAGYMSGNIIWRIKYYDVFFGLMLVPFIFKKDYYLLICRNSSYRMTTYYLFFISLYFLFVFGIIVPIYKEYYDLSFFLQKNRQYFYALPIFLMCYRYSITSVHVFYKILIVFSIAVLVSYMFTLLTPLRIVPFFTLDRYGEGTRLAMFSYGLIYWILPLGIILLTLAPKSNHLLSNYILFGALLMLITILLTLTRREFLRIIFMVFAIPLFLKGINKVTILNKYFKFLFPSIIAILAVSILFPQYIDLSVKLINDTFHLVIKGETNEGIVDYRLTGTGDMEIVKNIIKNNPYFGIGYYPAQWSNVVEMKREGNELGFALDASSEVPVYGAMMRLGFIGLIIPLLFYIFLIRIWTRVYKFIKNNYTWIAKYPIETMILLLLSYLLLAKFTIEAYNLFGEFYSPYSFTSFAVILGIWLGLFQRFKLIFLKQETKTLYDINNLSYL